MFEVPEHLVIGVRISSSSALVIYIRQGLIDVVPNPDRCPVRLLTQDATYCSLGHSRNLTKLSSNDQSGLRASSCKSSANPAKKRADH
jgi:hypothetical protein